MTEDNIHVEYVDKQMPTWMQYSAFGYGLFLTVITAYYGLWFAAVLSLVACWMTAPLDTKGTK